MDLIFSTEKVYLGKSSIQSAGRGVFARKEIKRGELIEVCPVIVLPESEREYIRKTNLRSYYFQWGDNLKAVGIALGFGSLYNHSYTPNAKYIKKMEDRLLEFVAIKDIERDEEITVNYNFGDPDDKTPLWFEVKS